jgi:hypothetical protein
MEAWRTTRIDRGINPLTELIEGDDAGYRDMPTLRQNRSPLIVPNVTIRASYDGTDEFGEKQDALPGGLVEGKLVLRETAARGIELLNQLVYEASDGEFAIVALDGFRSEERQAAGFTRLLRQQMSPAGVTEGNHLQNIPAFMRCSRIADGTFSWVRLAESPRLQSVLSGLQQDAEFTAGIAQWIMADLEIDLGDVQTHHYQSAIREYLTVSANCGFGHGAGLLLNSECNAHAGGGACDVFVFDKTGKPMNLVYFDYAGPEAGMDFMEHDGAYEQYCTAVGQNPLLAQYLRRCGFDDISKFTLHEWERIRGAIRILYHAARGAGMTYYSSDHGGENWHLEPGNIVYEPSTGGVVAFEGLTAQLHPNSGNPGHTLQTLGKGRMAVWGGATAHSQARLNFGL